MQNYNLTDCSYLVCWIGFFKTYRPHYTNYWAAVDDVEEEYVCKYLILLFSSTLPLYILISSWNTRFSFNEGSFNSIFVSFGLGFLCILFRDKLHRSKCGGKTGSLFTPLLAISELILKLSHAESCGARLSSGLFQSHDLSWS